MSAIPALAPSNFLSVIIASADPAFRDRVRRFIGDCEFNAIEASGGADALAKIEGTSPAIIVIDRGLPDLEPTDLTAFIREHYPAVHIFILDSGSPESLLPTAFLGQASAVDLNRLLMHLSAARKEMPTCAEVIGFPAGDCALEVCPEVLPGVGGKSQPMQQIARLVRLVAPRNTAVMICGETGTGKELVARAIHQLSGRAKGPFVTVGCAAIPDTLLEAELFGHTRGAFTGAMQSRVGRVQAAQGGTLFLDEIGEMPMPLQAKLLRFLQEGEIQRLGSNEVTHTDVRIVAATNADLVALVTEKRFRADLYFRLSAFPMMLPPLRSRQGDVELLAKRFLLEFNQAAGDSTKFLSPAALAALTRQAWPGNVRELRHTVERAVILSEGQEAIQTTHLSPLFAPVS